jgi:tRNA dimethylallyltransferase
MSQRLHPHDIHRLGRALEVIRATGLSQSEWGQMHPKTLRPVLKILVDPPLAVLEDRLKTRLEAMLQQGLVQEVALFYAHHWPCTSNLSKAVGLSPLIAHCQGDMSLEEALHRVFLETRHYVKRQRTWLKKYFQADAVVNDSFQVFSF